MSLDEKQVKEMLRKKDQEIMELKELLAEAEAEIKELNDFHGFAKPKGSILESTFLNKLIKRTAFLLIVVVIVLIGVYPWLFKDTLVGDNGEEGEPISAEELDAMSNTDTTTDTTPADNAVANGTTTDTTANANAGRDIFNPPQEVEVVSDLGWLNVRTEPNVETGDVIKRINSGEKYEWLEKTSDNWYKIVLDEEGHTGYVSGEYVAEQ